MSDPDRVEITFTREEFYNKLWEMPTTKLAAELGCSDVMIGKVCKSFNIPKPYLGYWAQLAHGKRPKRTRLPKDDDPHIQSLTFFKYPQQETKVNEPPRETLYDQDIKELLARARSFGPILVPDDLRNPHKLVSDWKSKKATELANEKLPWDRRTSTNNQPALDIQVSDKQVNRALRIMDSLIKRIEKVGGGVEVRGDQRNPHLASTMVLMSGEAVTSIRLRERTNMVRIKDPKAKYEWDRERTENIHNGLLLFDRGPSDYYNWMPKDTKTRKLEDSLGEFVIECIKKIGESRIKKREQECARIARLEKERIEHEAALELKLRQEELQRRQHIEQAKLDRLLSDANAWRQSQIIRDYLDAFCSLNLLPDGSLPIHNEVANYLRWAFAYAARIDPLQKSPPSVLDERIDK